MPDRTIKCIDCGNEFLFTDREQEWYREKGLQHEPRRCKTCRSSRKAADPGASHHREEHPPRPAHDPASAPGQESGAPHGEGSSSRPDRPRRPSSRTREMFKVACSACGKETEIPFKPDLSRPVYCRDCYLARGKKR